MGIGGPVRRDHTLKDNRPCLLDGEFRALNKVRKIRLKKRLIDPRLAGRLPQADRFRWKLAQNVVQPLKQLSTLGVKRRAARAGLRHPRYQLGFAGAEQRADHGIKFGCGGLLLERWRYRLDLVAHHVEPFLAAVAQEALKPRLDLAALQGRCCTGARAARAHVFKQRPGGRHAIKIIAKLEIVRLRPEVAPGA